MDIDDIPMASNIVDASLKKETLPEKPAVVQQTQQTQQTQEYVDMYNKQLMLSIRTAISYMQKKSKTSSFVHVDFNQIFTISAGKSVKLHTIHYGFVDNRRNHWNARKPFTSETKSPFKLLQELLEKKGYYLLDESDNQLSFHPRFVIYAQKPEDYDEREVLWHKLNIL